LNQHDGGGMTSIPVADTLIRISRKTQPKIVKQPTTQLFRTTALSASTPFILKCSEEYKKKARTEYIIQSS
jgi:hypothetical protein